MDSGPSNVNVVEGKSGGCNKNKNQKPDFKKKKKNIVDLICFACNEPNHIAGKCLNRKGKKGDGQKLQMWLLLRLGILSMFLKFS
jgi:hypothetical protein